MIPRFVSQRLAVGALATAAIFLGGCGLEEPPPDDPEQPPPSSQPDDRMKVDLTPEVAETDPLPGSDPSSRARRIRPPDPGNGGSGCGPARPESKVTLVTPGDRLGQVPLVIPTCRDEQQPAHRTKGLDPIRKQD